MIYVAIIFALCTTIQSFQTSTNLTVGQHYHVGNVMSEIINDELCITYQTNGQWYLDEYHLWIGTDLEDMPQAKKGNPKIGKFPYIGTVDATTVIVCLELEALDVNIVSFCSVPQLIVVAHAIVSRDADFDDFREDSETAFGSGFSIAKSIAMAFTIDTCFKGQFDAIALDQELTELSDNGVNDGVVNIQVTHNRGNPKLPYFTGQIDFDQDGTGDLTGLDMNCVDLDNRIGSRWYCSLIISSYNPDVGDLVGIINDRNLDMANYVINNFAIGDDLGTQQYVTGGDIQRVLWSLIYGILTNEGAYSSGPSSIFNVNSMLASAAMFGDGYIVGCDDYVAIIIYPVECEGDESIVAQAQIAHVPVSSFDDACKIVCALCM